MTGKRREKVKMVLSTIGAILFLFIFLEFLFLCCGILDAWVEAPATPWDCIIALPKMFVVPAVLAGVYYLLLRGWLWLGRKILGKETEE